MKTVAGLLAYASLVAGHGYVTNATIGGSAYTFYQPYTDPYTSPTPSRVSRPIQGNGPVEVLTYSDLQCGGDTADGVNGSSPANLTATVAAGSTVDLYWTLWPTSHVGPTITYMAKCANDDCTTYMPDTDTVWFKVQEQGRTGTSDTWGATAVMTAGGYVSYTVPECIESGAYLVRHEIIALHSAETAGGAQFYPGCHQIKVTGGTGASTPSDLVAFPGAYSAEDPGILYNPYEATTYTIPGPSLFTCDGSSGASASGSSSASASAAVTGAGSAPTGSAAATSSFSTVTVSSTASVNLAAATTAPASSDDGGDDDDCAAETVTSTYSAAAPTATPAASDDGGDDDGCDAEGDDGSDSSATVGAASGSSSSTSGTTTGSDSSSGDGEDDGCDAEGEEPTATGSYASQPTGSASSGSDDGDDCDAEEEAAYARRFVGRFARGL